MLSKKSSLFRITGYGFVSFVSLLLSATADVKAQMPSVPVPSPEAEAGDDFWWWKYALFVLALGLGGAIYWAINNRKADRKTSNPRKLETADRSFEIDALDANKELEWFRKNQRLVGKSGSLEIAGQGSQPANNLKNNNLDVKQENSQLDKNPDSEKPLPIFSIARLELARPFSPLPLSNDEALMSAIEQTHDEFEEDEEVRDLALRILTAFKTRNSIEALSQMALYDLSANLRSKAVTILSDFNHESVFEPILQATADPTREVRAAAARSMSKLTFDRADAWTRILETEEEGRMRQSARAAIESGFVEMSFDRLVHQDPRYCYEAFALMALLIRAGETGTVFQALENHPNMNVRKAILHVIKTTKDQKALEGLYSVLERNNLPLEMQEEVDKTIEEIGFVTV